MKSFAIKSLVDALQETSFSIIPSFIHLAQIIIGILLAIEFIREAIGLAHGQGFKLSKKMITWVLVMILIAAFYHKEDKNRGLAGGIYATAKSFGEGAFEEFDASLVQFLDNCGQDEPSLGIGSIFKPKKLFYAMGYAVAVAIGAVCFLLIYVLICGSYGCLALFIVVGPVAFAFLLNDELRAIGIRWVNSIVNNLLIIIVYGVTMRMVTAILSSTIKAAKDSLSATSLLSSLLVLLVGPMLAIGLVHQGPKAVMSLIGGVTAASGGGEMAAGFVGGMIGSAAARAGKAVWEDTKKAWNQGKGGRSQLPPIAEGGGGERGTGGGDAGTMAGAGGGGGSPTAAPASASGNGADRATWGERLMPNFIKGMERFSRALDREKKRDGDAIGASRAEGRAAFVEGAQPSHEEPGPAAD